MIIIFSIGDIEVEIICSGNQPSVEQAKHLNHLYMSILKDMQMYTVDSESGWLFNVSHSMSYFYDVYE